MFVGLPRQPRCCRSLALSAPAPGFLTLSLFFDSLFFVVSGAQRGPSFHPLSARPFLFHSSLLYLFGSACVSSFCFFLGGLAHAPLCSLTLRHTGWGHPPPPPPNQTILPPLKKGFFFSQTQTSVNQKIVPTKKRTAAHRPHTPGRCVDEAAAHFVITPSLSPSLLSLVAGPPQGRRHARRPPSLPPSLHRRAAGPARRGGGLPRGAGGSRVGQLL